jgi:predicted TIM-barrel enzyme
MTGFPSLARTLPETLRDIHVPWILCPWLKPSARECDLWTSVLSVHDVNGALLSVLPEARGAWNHVYAGVFAVDVTRTAADLIRPLRAAGVGGVINFPSVSFIDGSAGATLEQFSMGVEKEFEHLEQFSKAGLRIGGVVSSVEASRRLLNIGVDFLVVHQGPPASRDTDAIGDLLETVTDMARTRHTKVTAFSQLLKSL